MKVADIRGSQLIPVGITHPSMVAWAAATVGQLQADHPDRGPFHVWWTGTVVLEPTRIAAELESSSAVIARHEGRCHYVVADSILALDEQPDGLETVARAARAAPGGCSALKLDSHSVADDPMAPVGHLVLGDKARALDLIGQIDGPWAIERPHLISREEWLDDRRRVLDDVVRRFGGRPMVVRSASDQEDAWSSSAAGRFLSVLDVDPTDGAQVTDAVDAVFASYETAGARDRVFAQQYLHLVDQSGVLMTEHPESGAPYCVIAEDRVSGRTDRITSGASDDHVTAYIDESVVPGQLPPEFERYVVCGRALRALLGLDGLDIEYATIDSLVHVLQVRPIVRTLPARLSEREHRRLLIAGAQRRYRTLAPGTARTPGQPAVYSMMADWNPAEMIGRRPPALAHSLYRRLITDRVWAVQRVQYGYRDLRGVPLLRDFCGHAYVDVRASLTSFLPATTADDVAERLVSAQLERLAARPHLDDKIEFEIAHTCATAGMGSLLRSRYRDHLAENEVVALEDALLALTIRGMRQLDSRINELSQLVKRQRQPGTHHQVTSLLADIQRFGTLPFAHLARTAFVTTAILRSLVAADVISPDEERALLQSIRTVAGQLLIDAWRVRMGSASLDDLVAEYGHLRPGTYDLRVPRYAADTERYLGSLVHHAAEIPDIRMEPSADLCDRVTAALGTMGLRMSAHEFFTRLNTAVAGREQAKHVFSRSVSDLLEQVADWGEELGFSRDDLTQVEIGNIEIAMQLSRADAQAWIGDVVSMNRSRGGTTALVELPDVLLRERDFAWHESHRLQPMFITRSTVRGPIVVVNEAAPTCDVRGAIIAMERADPGYDYLLSLGVAGIITAYGGANSHMAVRCTELQIPAAIGVGQERLRQLATQRTVVLDAATRRLFLE